MVWNNSHCSWGTRIWELNFSLGRKISSQTVSTAPAFLPLWWSVSTTELRSSHPGTPKTKVLGKFLFHHKGEDAIACKTSNGDISQVSQRDYSEHLSACLGCIWIPPSFWNCAGSRESHFIECKEAKWSGTTVPRGGRVANISRRILKDKQQYMNLWVGTTVLATLMKDDVICACFILWDWAMRMLF